MKSYRFKALLGNDGWLENAVVEIDEFGKIASISEGETSAALYVNGFALPGFQNAHSHAFQYAMAGTAENHAEGEIDDFWSWREAMYGLAENVDPDRMKTIAAMLYSELLRLGYTNVAEFHYVHHDKNGEPYNNPAAMGEALIEAAKETGIRITLVPIFYQKGGFGKPASARQKRFISKTFDDYMRLFEASASACKQYEGANIAVGIHSMRGVGHEDILRTIREGPQDVPFHIHVSEQIKEVEDCVQFLGKRPVEWLLDNCDLNERFHLVHATHLSEDETQRLAVSGANVVLCPSTEANLGDGIFPLKQYQSHGGNWSIGTDSHTGLNPFEELRLLDYGQRLTTYSRTTFPGDAGLYAINQATIAGRRAMNDFQPKFFALSEPFDACIVSANAPLLANAAPENRASVILYTAVASHVFGTFVGGKFIDINDNRSAVSTVSDNFMKCLR
jgi:formiminoglutamate deiminase